MTNRYASALGRLGARVRMAKLARDLRRAIADKAQSARKGGALPESLRSLFPEGEFETLHLPRDRSIVMRAVLASGSPAQIGWLRVRYGRAGIQRWIRSGGGRGLPFERLLPWFTQDAARRWATPLPPGEGRRRRR
jgi:hypothetical protein